MRIPEVRSGTGPGSSARGFFFTTPALRLRLDLVRDYIHNGCAPVLVSGESDAGKSAFLDQIVCRADGCWRLVRIPAIASFSPFEIVTFFNTELRLPVGDSVDAMIAELDRFLGKLAVRGRIAVAVVDDAHELADASLVQLVTLSEKLATGNYRLLMTGAPALRPRLTALLNGMGAPVRPHVVTIPSLDAREVASYIEMKLHHEGLDGRSAFCRSIVDDIAHSSNGRPGRIDAITNEFLSGERKRVDGCLAAERIRRLVVRLSQLRVPL